MSEYYNLPEIALEINDPAIIPCKNATTCSKIITHAITVMIILSVLLLFILGILMMIPVSPFDASTVVYGVCIMVTSIFMFGIIIDKVTESVIVLLSIIVIWYIVLSCI